MKFNLILPLALCATLTSTAVGATTHLKGSTKKGAGQEQQQDIPEITAVLAAIEESKQVRIVISNNPMILLFPVVSPFDLPMMLIPCLN